MRSAPEKLFENLLLDEFILSPGHVLNSIDETTWVETDIDWANPDDHSQPFPWYALGDQKAYPRILQLNIGATYSLNLYTGIADNVERGFDPQILMEYCPVDETGAIIEHAVFGLSEMGVLSPAATNPTSPNVKQAQACGFKFRFKASAGVTFDFQEPCEVLWQLETNKDVF